MCDWRYEGPLSQAAEQTSARQPTDRLHAPRPLTHIHWLTQSYSVSLIENIIIIHFVETHTNACFTHQNYFVRCTINLSLNVDLLYSIYRKFSCFAVRRFLNHTHTASLFLSLSFIGSRTLRHNFCLIIQSVLFPQSIYVTLHFILVDGHSALLSGKSSERASPFIFLLVLKDSTCTDTLFSTTVKIQLNKRTTYMYKNNINFLWVVERVEVSETGRCDTNEE